jgi:hypothetical protein
MKKSAVVFVALSGFLFGAAGVRAAELNVAGSSDVYGQVDLFNFGVGGGLDHWFDNTVGIGGGVSGGGDFVDFNVRMLFLVGNAFDIVKTPARVFLGAGVAWVQGPSFTRGGVTSRATGFGPELSGGVLWETPWVKNFYLRPEVVAHLFKVKTTINAGGILYDVDSGFGAVDLRVSAVFRF